jgi:hypothetical protein
VKAKVKDKYKGRGKTIPEPKKDPKKIQIKLKVKQFQELKILLQLLQERVELENLLLQQI